MTARNALYYGDNLDVLRESVASESVDLIYLDPPFNSNASYNVLFKAVSGESSAAQIEAFEDTWHWNESAARAFDEVLTGPRSEAAIMLRAMRAALGENDMMAYLAMMAARLIELHRVLKPTGSLYLHCDPTASHYLKLLLDAVFGPERYQNEIIWKRGHAHNSAKRCGPSHDVILFYSKGSKFTWNKVFHTYDQAYTDQHYAHVDERGRHKRENPTGAGTRNGETGKPWRGIDVTAKGRHWVRPPAELDELDRQGLIYWPNKPGAWPYLKLYLDDMKGVPLQDVWTDIDVINMRAAERLGYPTQKPVALLERILSASSNPGDVVLDPFCGCGTSIHAAQKLKRTWVGIDVTHLAISLVERRLKGAFPHLTYDVVGVPRDLGGARDLAERDKHEFQKWITAKVGAQPYRGGRKGMDRGIDGYLHFRDADRQPQFAIVSVKGGAVKSGDVRDLKGTMEREKAALGLFLTLNEPTREMEREAASTGFYETGEMRFPRLQILTAAQVLDDRRPQVPFGFADGFRKAAYEPTATQPKLDI